MTAHNTRPSLDLNKPNSIITFRNIIKQKASIKI